MGQTDICLKRYLGHDERFADLINGILGDGEQGITAENKLEGGIVNMCKAMQELMADSKEAGKGAAGAESLEQTGGTCG